VSYIKLHRCFTLCLVLQLISIVSSTLGRPHFSASTMLMNLEDIHVLLFSVDFEMLASKLFSDVLLQVLS
jgi:hypothetical protein